MIAVRSFQKQNRVTALLKSNGNEKTVIFERHGI